MSQPQPPPEAVLIRRVREAGGLKLPTVAKGAGISVARWSQIENGYETRQGERRPVQGSRGTVAHMAAELGISPGRLETEGQRPDAAAVLREIQRSPHDGQDSSAPGRDTREALVADLDNLIQRLEAMKDDIRFGGPGRSSQERRHA
jgi:transcriptional regulator with XRE-family HTH domain